MNKENPACAECKETRAMVGSAWLYCPDCDEVYCGRVCWNEHVAVCKKLKMHREQRRKWEQLFDEKETGKRTHEQHCAWCGKATPACWVCICHDLPLCKACYLQHTSSIHCTSCGIDGFSGLTKCDTCKQWFCPSHVGRRATRQWLCEHCQQQQSNHTRDNGNGTYTHTFNFDPGQADDFLKFVFGNMGQTYRGPFTRGGSSAGTAGTNAHAGGSAPSSLPRHVQDAHKTLGISGRPSAEQVREAFRTKVKAAADGKGGYRGDMDKLRKAKEAALQYAESRRS